MNAETNSTGPLCPRCGAALAPQARGHCPACLLRALLSPDPSPPPPFPAPPGYTLLQELGRGGTGVVWKARQQSLGREVALKVLAAGLMASESDRLRLRREAEAMARLRHPHIVKIHEVGEVEGHFFLAMELLTGGSLAERLRAGPLAEQEAAALLRDAADALAHAHEKGVIHRDLKPGNILLDDFASPHLADFGLAKLLPQDPAATPAPASPFELTLSGQPLGTVHYLAPEQAGAAARLAGPGVDIHSLGAVLYHCLTGRPPYLGLSFAETIRQVTEEDPPPVRQLNPAISRDLETICHKCLRKQPGQRYPSAGALRDDLNRFLQGVPVMARPIGNWERFTRRASRHPFATLLLVSLVLALAGWFASLFWQLHRVKVANDKLNHRDLIHALELATIDLKQQETLRGVTRLARAARDHPNKSLPTLRLGAILNQRSWLVLDFQCGPESIGSGVFCFHPSAGIIAAGQKDEKGVRVQLYTLQGQSLGDPWRPPLPDLNSLEFSSSGTQLLARAATNQFASLPLHLDQLPPLAGSNQISHTPAAPRGQVTSSDETSVWGTTRLSSVTNSSAIVLTIPGEVPAGGAYWSPPGTPPRFVTAFRGGIRIRDGLTGDLLAESPEMGWFDQTVAWAPDGNSLAVSALGQPLGFWTICPAPVSAHSHPINAIPRNIEWTPDGYHVVVSSDAPGVWLLDARKDGDAVKIGNWSRLACSHHGSAIYVGNPTGRLGTFSLAHTNVQDLGLALGGAVDRLALDASDRWLAVATMNQLLYVIDTRSGQLRSGPQKIAPHLSGPGSLDRVLGLALAPDGTSVAVASGDDVAGVWTLPDLQPRFHWQTNAPFTSAAYSPDGRWLALGSMLGSAWLVDTVTGQPRQLLLHPEEVYQTFFSADGRRLIACDRNGRARIWGIPDGKLEVDIKVGDFQSQWAAFAPEGNSVAAIAFHGRTNGVLTWWDAETGQELADPLVLNSLLVRAAFSPQGQRLAVGGTGGAFWLVDPPIPDGEPVPGWALDLAEALVGTRILADGSLQRVSPAELSQFRRSLRSVTSPPGWAAIARRFALPAGF